MNWTMHDKYETKRTLLLANIFKRKRQAGVLPLDNANLSEGTFSDHAKEAKVVEVDWLDVSEWLLGHFNESGLNSPASLQATGFP